MSAGRTDATAPSGTPGAASSAADGGVALSLAPSPDGRDPARPTLELDHAATFGLTEEEARKADLVWSAGMVIAMALLFALLTTARGVAVPVLLGLAGAYVLNPVVTFLSRRGLSRTLATVAVFAGVLLVVAGASLYIVPVLRDEALKLPDFFVRASKDALPSIQKLTGVPLPQLFSDRMAELGSEASHLLKSAGPALARFAAAFAGNTARMLAALMGLLVVPVLGFFFLQDFPKVTAKARALLPRKSEALISRRFAEVDEVLSAFVRGQLTLGAILSVLYAIGLSLARIDMAIVIGLIAGFGNLVPYLGTGIGVTLATVAVVVSWHGPWQLVAVAATFVIAQAAEGLLITPRIVGEKVGLPAVVVIIAVLAFGEVFGFVGILLAVPASAVLKVVLRVVIERYQRSRLYTGEPAAPKSEGHP